MRIFLDMDETLVNLVDPWLDYLNSLACTEYTRDNTTNYSVEGSFQGKLSTDVIFKPFNTPGFWKGLPPFQGAVEFVQRLVDNDFDVYIATIPARGEVCAYEKEQWVQEHLPFLGRERLIMAHHKHVLRGDAILDDKPSNIVAFKGLPLLFDKPWNQDSELKKEHYHEGMFIRVHSFEEAFNRLIQLELPF